MYLHVQTQWPCWSPNTLAMCEGSLVVIAEPESYSVACNKCGLGSIGKGNIPRFWIDKLIDQGYIKQLSRRPAELKDVLDFMLRNSRKHRTPQETAGDLLEHFEVFWK